MALISNQILLRGKRVLREHFPAVLICASRLAAETFLFRNERRFLEGVRESSSPASSLLFFTSIRCGSQLVDSILADFYSLTGGVSLNLGKYYFHSGVEREGQILGLEEARVNFPKQGYYYGPIKPIENGFDLSPYKVITLVRDPRDVMVSYFYSMAFAHTPQNRRYAEEAKEVRERGIEWFVRQEYRLNLVGSDFRNFLENTWERPDALSWRYEDFVQDQGLALSELADFLEVGEDGEALISSLVAKQQETFASGGSQYGHFRSGESGQFRRCLSNDTVDYLTEWFRDVLEGFGYLDSRTELV